MGFCAPGGRLTWNRTCLGGQARPVRSWGSTAGGAGADRGVRGCCCGHCGSEVCRGLFLGVSIAL